MGNKFDLKEKVEFRYKPNLPRRIKGYVIDHKVDDLLGDLYAIKRGDTIFVIPEKHIYKL